ncbi:hypothetical protein ACYRFS_04240 [Listeria kieliensis]|uniref:hypothetical protein n=1 Tax=Listeria kieliensis TaxID=1621700 RepID=UPI001F0B7EDA|nr:hypothetical protein [Listeria kieliensis]
MLLNLNNGELRIADDLVFYPGYTFDEFKQTSFYKGQDGIRLINLDGFQEIDEKKYVVNFFFRDGKIYVVSLINCDVDIPEGEEGKRKEIHDLILKQNGIESGTSYKWGEVVSEFDKRSNISSIDIYYAQ